MTYSQYIILRGKEKGVGGEKAGKAAGRRKTEDAVVKLWEIVYTF
nr:hypothetical protein [uncultured Sellimonas sp.]